MKTIELSTGTLLVVATPDKTVAVELYDKESLPIALMCYVEDPAGRFKPGIPHPIYPIPERFQLLGHPSEITGEVWGKVVEVVSGWSSVLYYDYVTPCSDYRDIVDAAHKDPLQSGLSLCAAHGIKETDVLLFKSKNS